MSFSDAIPLNRVTASDFAFSKRSSHQQEFARRGDRREAAARQKVNISEDTMLRIARSRLSRAVSTKLGYDQHGVLARGEDVVGQIFNVKA